MTIALIGIALLISVALSIPVHADNPAGLGFLELDGNVVPGNCNGNTNCNAGTSACASPLSTSSVTDWSCLFNQVSIFTGSNTPTAAQIAAAYVSNGLPANAVVSSFVPNGYAGGPLCPTAAGSSCVKPHTYTSGSKDILDISANSCASANNLLAKDYLVNTYGIKYINPADNHQIVYIGDEKQSNGGDNNIGVWFDQGTVSVPTPCPSGSGTPFVGNHVVGDILTVSNFTKGGILSGINAYVWVGALGTCSGTYNGFTLSGSTPLCHLLSGNQCGSTSVDICGIVSHVTTAGVVDGSPSGNVCGFSWVTLSKELGGMNNTLAGGHCTAVDSFYEMGIDLTALGFTSCASTAIPETRSSQQLTATLFDFTILNLNSCQTATSTLSSQTGAIAAGTTVTDKATVTSTQGGGTPTGSVQFYACGPTTTAMSCSILPGNALGSPVTLNSAGVATSGAVSGTSTPVNDNGPGFYCFSAVYTPTGGFLASQSTTTTNECFEVVTSAISTSVSPSTIALGSSATDTATVTLTPGSATVSGTVTFTVFGPVSTNTATCTTVAKSFSAVAIGPGASPASVPSGSFTPTLAGYYFWEATYTPTGVANGNTVTSQCGASGETLTVVSSAISTSVSPTPIALGSSASDTAKVTLTPGTSTVSGTVDFKVYGPVATNTPTCSALAGSFPGVAIGPGVSSQSASSGSFTPTAPGYYFWTATYNPAGAANGNSVSTTCGDSGETLLVISSAISTSVSPTPIALGSSSSDTATVTLTPGTSTVSGTVDFTVYGPFSTSTATCTTVAKTFTGVTIGPGVSPQSAASGSFTPTLAGYYFWTATYNPSGAANGNSVSTKCGDTGETLLVISSAISTTVSPSTIAFGSSSSDTATVTLTPSSAVVGGTVTFTVYGPVATNTPTCTNVAQTFSGVPIGGPSPQTANSGTFTPTAAGYYFWTATYNPSGAANGNTVSTSCGDSGETLLVISSAISTSVSPTPIALGSSSSDTAKVTLTPSTSTVSGTVDFEVFGPIGTNTPTCTTLAGSFLAIPIGPGVSPQTASSGSFTPTLPGYYFWTATYNPAGAANGNSVSTSCGDNGETLLVISSAISTSVSPSTITFGSTAKDTATVTLTPGTSIVSGTVDFTVYGPVTTNTPTCSTVAASFLGVSIGPGVSPQSATSGSFKPAAIGYYFWTATYHPAGAANGNSVSTKCGDSGETLLVSSIPKVTFFGYNNNPTNNDPTLGSGTVQYTFTVHNYGTGSVTLGGSFDLSASTTGVVSGCASTGVNTISFTGVLGTFSGVTLASGADATFVVTCNYSGVSGNVVSAALTVSFTDVNSITGPVSGSPASVSFTIQQT